jgi:hypothetical protein
LTLASKNHGIWSTRAIARQTRPQLDHHATCRALLSEAVPALWIAAIGMPEASPALIARALQLTPPQLSSPARRHRDVAAALFISTKTVEANLVRIYRKLGIKTRAELGRIIGDA